MGNMLGKQRGRLVCMYYVCGLYDPGCNFGGKGTHIQRVIFLCCVIAVGKKAKHRLALWSLVLS